MTACENGCHKIETDDQNGSFKHLFENENCIHCHKCVNVCNYGAMEICGYSATVDEVIHEALKDKAFYGKKGGITLSGGEPMTQPEFANSILKTAKDKKLTTCVETCGIGTEKLDMELCDYIYYDIKTSDSQLHKKLTGMDNGKIISNLINLSETDPSKIYIRSVIVKGITDTEKHVNDIIDVIKPLGITHFDLLAFHPYGSSKANTLGMKREFMGKEYIPGEENFRKLKESINL